MAKLGRPPSLDPLTADVRVRLTSEQATAIDRLAQDLGLTTSEWLRRCINAWLSPLPLEADGWAVALPIGNAQGACDLCQMAIVGDVYRVFGDSRVCADCRRMVGDMANHEFTAHLATLANALLEYRDGQWVAKPQDALLPY